MKSYIGLHILCLVSVKLLGYSCIENQDSLKQFFSDYAFVASFDSAFMSNYNECLFNEDVDYKSSYIPSFSDSIYKSRIDLLNKQSPIDIVFNHYVKQYIDVYTKRRRGQLSRMMGLAKYYFPLFEEILDQFDLPIELKYLAVVESALNPKAKSWAGATGLWQFMYSTGKEYDLKISSYVDERMDPIKSTIAACKFFEKSYAVYGDWPLTIASYNSGRGNVNKAIRRAGGKKNYWKIRPFLPKETRSYFPAFIAVCYAMNYTKEHEIYLSNTFLLRDQVDTVNIKYQINLDYVSEVLNIPIKVIEFLNPSYKINVIPHIKDRKYYLSLPKEKIGVFVANEKEIYNYFIKLDEEQKKSYPKYSEEDERILYLVKSGDFLGKIAQKYGCKIINIKEWNGLKNDRIRVGQKLVLYVRPDYI